MLTPRQLLLFIVSIIAFAGTALADVTKVTTRGKMVHAQYFQYTEGFCNGLSVEIFAGEEITRRDNNATFTPRLIVQLVGINSCSGQSFFMSGTTEQLEFKVLGNLATADVSGNVVVMDDLGNTKQVSIALSWRGGALTRDSFKHVSSTALSRTILKSASAIRHSEVVNGSILVDGFELLSASNITDNSGIFGFMSMSSGATIEITRMR